MIFSYGRQYMGSHGSMCIFYPNLHCKEEWECQEQHTVWLQWKNADSPHYLGTKLMSHTVPSQLYQLPALLILLRRRAHNQLLHILTLDHKVQHKKEKSIENIVFRNYRKSNMKILLRRGNHAKAEMTKQTWKIIWSLAFQGRFHPIVSSHMQRTIQNFAKNSHARVIMKWNGGGSRETEYTHLHITIYLIIQ